VRDPKRHSGSYCFPNTNKHDGANSVPDCAERSHDKKAIQLPKEQEREKYEGLQGHEGLKEWQREGQRWKITRIKNRERKRQRVWDDGVRKGEGRKRVEIAETLQVVKGWFQELLLVEIKGP
jgi:hypothetical protein